MKEWGFDVDSEEVDLNRLCRELDSGNMSAILQKMYIENLRVKAPIVFERLKAYSKENNVLNWVSW